MKQSEARLQRSVAQYLDLKGWLWMHVANERHTSPARGRKLKEAGVKRGVPDILIFEKWDSYGIPDVGTCRGFPGGFGIAIELKSPKGRTTTEQEAWLDALEKRGWYCSVCRSIREVVDLCERLLGNA